MKQNKKRILLVAILFIILVSIIAGYTYSKYAQSYQSTISTAVARWNFTGEVVNAGNSSLTSTISLADTIDSDSITKGKIAPGTNGEFDIIIDATGSEVDLSYDVEILDETDKPQNLFFTYEGENYDSLSDLISSLNSDSKKVFSGEILESDPEKTVTYHVSWSWPYETEDEEGNLLDEIDLIDGQNISDYIFTVKITGSQIK